MQTRRVAIGRPAAFFFCAGRTGAVNVRSARRSRAWYARFAAHRLDKRRPISRLHTKELHVTGGRLRHTAMGFKFVSLRRRWRAAVQFHRCDDDLTLHDDRFRRARRRRRKGVLFDTNSQTDTQEESVHSKSQINGWKSRHADGVSGESAAAFQFDRGRSNRKYSPPKAAAGRHPNSPQEGGVIG